MLVFPQNVGRSGSAFFRIFTGLDSRKTKKTGQTRVFMHFPIAPSKKMHNNLPAFQPQPKGALA
jgi:hypothetical protein